MVAQVIVNATVAGCTYALIALSFGLIYRAFRFFHFAHAGVLALGPYLCLLFRDVCGFPLGCAVLVACGLTGAIGMGMEVWIYRSMRRSGCNSTVLLVSSLGIYVVVQNVISLVFGDDTKVLRGEKTDSVHFWDVQITQNQLILIAVAGLAVAVLWGILRFTRLGKTYRAFADDRQLAESVGVDVNRIGAFAFAGGSALAGLSGILIGLDTDIIPTMGLNGLMMGVVAMVVGGVGNVPGIFLGSLLLGAAQHLCVRVIGAEWQESCAFAVLVICLLVRPQGIFCQPQRRAAP